jgi:hypothetical protein
VFTFSNFIGFIWKTSAQEAQAGNIDQCILMRLSEAFGIDEFAEGAVKGIIKKSNAKSFLRRELLGK